MKGIVPIAAAALATAGFAVEPIAAQQAQQPGPGPANPILDAQTRTSVIEVYGNDPCPAGGPEEIIVCARRPEADRYRIPTALRENPQRRIHVSWALDAEQLQYVGRTGIHSCSPAGAGGWTGCWNEMMRQAYEDRGVDPTGRRVP